MVTSLSINAIECNANLKFGIIIEPNHLRFTHEQRTVVQINDDTQLFIKGMESNLSTEQQTSLALYSKSIREKIPKIVSLINDGVEIRLQAMDTMIGGLTGENSRSHQKIQEIFSEMQYRLKLRFSHNDESYVISPKDFNDFDEFFTSELTSDLEDMVASSLGSIFVAFNGNNAAEQDLEQRMVAVGKELDLVSSDMELLAQSRANVLALKIVEFCETLDSLNSTENDVQQHIPSIKAFDLIQIQK